MHTAVNTLLINVQYVLMYGNSNYRVYEDIYLC